MRSMTKLICLLLATAFCAVGAKAADPTVNLSTGAATVEKIPEDLPWSERMLQSEMKRHPEAWMIDFQKRPRWGYVNGLVLLATEKVWKATGKQVYFDWVKCYADRMVRDDGTIEGYKIEKYNIDHVNAGKILFDVYKQTGEKKYRKALDLQRSQLDGQPRVNAGGFWHKQIYTNQMWLDGLYMGSPFYAQYATTFGDPENLYDVALQFILMETHARDPRSGLLYHGWDESHQMHWCNPQTGLSSNFWGRSNGWYMMALVDALDFFPEDHPWRGKLIAILQRQVEAIDKVQDPASGVWWQVLDQGNREGNYLEATCSTMFTYSILKGVRKGYLDQKYLGTASLGYKGVFQNLVTVDEGTGEVHLNHCCAVAGLGGKNKRDGSFEYYINERKRSDDGKGTGPFIMMALEVESMGDWLPENSTVTPADFSIE